MPTLIAASCGLFSNHLQQLVSLQQSSASCDGINKYILVCMPKSIIFILQQLVHLQIFSRASLLSLHHLMANRGGREIRAEMEALEQKIADMFALHKQEIDEEMDAYDEEMDGIKAELDVMRSRGEITALWNKIGETVAANKGIRGEMKALRKEIAGMKKTRLQGGEIEALKKEMAETIAQQKMQIAGEMEALTKEIARIKTFLDQMKNGGEMKALGKKIAETISSYRVIGGELKALRKEIAGMKSFPIGGEVEALKEEIARNDLERIKVGGDFKVLTKEVAGMKTDLDRIKEEIAKTVSLDRITGLKTRGETEALKKEIAGMKTTHQDRLQKISGEMKSLEKKISETVAQDRVKVGGEMKALRKEIAGMKTDLDNKNSRGEIEALRKEIAGIKTDFARRKDNGETEISESWRLKGNAAYEEGDMVKAEEYYTEFVNCHPGRDHLVLCYNNRALARMSQGKCRDAMRDCEAAAEIDPYFLTLHTTAANCHLLLGEVEAVVKCFSKCSKSGDYVCLDRRIILEAEDGLQKAQRVEKYRNDCEELMQQRTSESTANALSMIDEALSISPYSEKLLELKGKALLSLQKYEKAIQLCEKTLHLAEKNFPVASVEPNADGSECEKQNFVKLWRWDLMSKAYFHLGRLERTLDLLKERELLRSRTNIQDSSTLLVITVREILKHKNAGDEACKAERYTEAVEHYTAALSRSTGSRPVTAMCFCKRAAAHVKLEHFADAIADCNLAIALCGNYSEAIFVRAVTFIRVREYEQAANDITRLISAREKKPPGNFESSTVSDALASCSVEDLKGARSSLLSAKKMATTGTSLDVYLILGIHISDTVPETRKAYREAALRHHPDKVVGKFRAESGEGGKLSHEIADEIHKNAGILFKMIAEAYELLSDPTKRSTYDFQEERRKAEESKGNGSFPIPTEFRKLLDDLGFI